MQEVEELLLSARKQLELTRKDFRTQRRLFFVLTERCFPELEAAPQIQLMRSKCISIETGLPIRELDEYNSLRQVNRNERGVEVWTATRDDVTVALKSFPFTKLKSLERELKSLLRIKPHPSLIRYTAIVEDHDARRLYVEMPWFDEGSAVKWMGGRDTKSGRIDPTKRSPQAKRVLALQVLQALAQVHAAQVAHRDIKPDNILIANHGTSAVLADFEIAKLQPTTASMATTTIVRGSLRYMAPELFGVDPSGALSIKALQRADMYSVGATLHELHYGISPKPTHLYTSASMLPHNDAVGDSLRSMIAAMLHSDPSMRPTASGALKLKYFQEPITTARRECAICMDEVFAEKGVLCFAEKHFYCDDCLKVYGRT